MNKRLAFFSFLPLIWKNVTCQEYEVTDIYCRNGDTQLLRAVLRKPVGFKGVPIFADDRSTNPLTSVSCQIRPDISSDGLSYSLIVNDFSRCGTIVRNSFINIRVWFPQLPGVVMSTDKEVIIMCKPPESTLPLNQQESAEDYNLDYMVSLYKEAEKGSTRREKNKAVPIGTMLQLRATINTNSVWKHIKLLEVSLSPSKKDPNAFGHVMLVQDGCRIEEFSSIVPDQPKLSTNSTGEVHLDFEAVMLDANRDKTSQVWIHARSKACRDLVGCEPSSCSPSTRPRGRGRRETRGVEKDEKKEMEENEDKKEMEEQEEDKKENTLTGVGTILPFVPLERRFQVKKEQILQGGSKLINSKGIIVKNSDSNGSNSIRILKNYALKKSPSAREKEISARAETIEGRDLASRSDEDDKDTDFIDNVGLTVIMPGDEYYSPVHSEGKGKETVKSKISQQEDCTIFLAIGAAMGCLLIVASLIMCILAHKLHQTVRASRQEKSEIVLRDTRRKFGLESRAGGIYRSEALEPRHSNLLKANSRSINANRFGNIGLNRYVANPIHHIHENSTVRLEDRSHDLPHDRPGKPDLVDHTDTTSDLNDQLISEMRKRLIEMQVSREKERAQDENRWMENRFNSPNEDVHINYSSLTGIAALSFSEESDFSSGRGTSDDSPRFRDRLWRELLY
ncbi:uncharacterized protein LOC111704002 isoform X2 [Eurytemora carolleeae]|uniref:uncharacterized protein LOC111704002 isoform X2 n=1 Tax=Eurytemora carolleeae TaxID=1294199 RepID=UPI000C764467|nr:uncharacterized protein LOC111704002 isoform X2 [Eurytemora carolleeae]|eukprot:XP_023331875.1 uncharacterized protein LOC111704002 isoform X2 [Eurytemora affinis]